MRSFAISLVAGLIFLVASPPSALAQQPPEGEDEASEEAELSPEQVRAAAREAYGRGQELYREGKHAEAEQAFVEAYALIPNPVVLLGVAESREEQGNLRGAVEALETYLAEREDAPDAAEVQERIDTMRAAPAVLVITSTPAGAAIVLDGEDTGEVTPAEIEVEPGPHVVALQMEGYEAVEAQVEAEYASRPELELELAEVVVEEEPALTGDGAEVPGADIDDLEDVDEDDEGPGTAVWALSGVAAASLVAGTVLGFIALTEESEFEDAPTEATADKGERFALFADIAFGVAAVSAISAIVVFLTQGDDEDEEEDAEAAAEASFLPVVSPTGAGMVGQVQF